MLLNGVVLRENTFRYREGEKRRRKMLFFLLQSGFYKGFDHDN